MEYEGFFKDDKKNGYGREKSSDGTIYKGDFKDNQKHGKGTLILDGIKTWIYKGEFKNNKISGKGKFKWNEEEEYNGEWDNSELCGYGILKHKNTIHIGYFSHNNKNGYGANFFGTQFAILGKWENDNIEGFATIIPLIDLDQSNNIINTHNEYNYNSNEEVDNNFQIVRTFKGEIIQKNIEVDELNGFKSSKEYKDMVYLYKNKIYPDFIKNIDKNNSEENESNIESDK